MKSRWTFRCYPTPEQEEHLNRTFGCCRYVWNWALKSRSDAYRAGERMNYPATDKAMTVVIYGLAIAPILNSNSDLERGEFVKLWNKHCAESGTDVTEKVEYFLQHDTL